MIGYYGGIVIGLIFMVIGMIVGNKLKAKMKQYGSVGLRSGKSGAEIAAQMLQENGIHDVRIQQGQGFLTDHYNPVNKTVTLSPGVYQGRSVASAAIAAHEVGHALQHNRGYAMLQVRSALVPMVNFSARFVHWVILGGILMINIFPSLIWIGIGLFALTTLFSVITLPVEYDASRRALVWLEGAQITVGQEHEMAKDGLKWAARTYVVAALQSIATLFYYVMLAMGRRN